MPHRGYPRLILSDHCDLTHIAAPSGAASGWRRLRDLLALWRVRSRQRRNLRELAEWDACFLKDIGVSREDARREATKFFWER